MNISERALNYIASSEVDGVSPRSKPILLAMSLPAKEGGSAELARTETESNGFHTSFTVARAFHCIEDLECASETTD